jgi:hypothetical protein
MCLFSGNTRKEGVLSCHQGFEPQRWCHSRATEEVSFFCSHFNLHKVYVSASQLLLLLLFSLFVFQMETDNSLLERCCVVTLRLAGMSEEELLMIPFVDLTGLCHSVGLHIACRHVEQITVIRSWRLSHPDDPVLPLEASGGEDEPVSVDGVEEPGFHGGFSLPGSPYPGVAASPTLPVPVSRK